MIRASSRARGRARFLPRAAVVKPTHVGYTSWLEAVDAGPPERVALGLARRMNHPHDKPAGHGSSGRRSPALRARQRLGKYRVRRKISEGGFAEVYEADDTIEGIRVALRVPRPDIVDDDLLASFRKEVRLLARFEHPNVLPVKSADVIDGLFVIATMLGEETLGDALERRLTTGTILDYGEQLLLAVSQAHEHGVIHCDIKPDNLILFRGGRLRLTDFGIAKVTLGTILASGSGTIGYLAPEQALGRPTVRSDVFATALVFWQMLSGQVPEWPFDWPLPGADRVRRKVHPELVDWMRRALEVDQRARFRDATQMLVAFRRLKSAGKLLLAKSQRKAKSSTETKDWRVVRRKSFDRRYRGALGLVHECSRCGGRLSEAMKGCPWCGVSPKRYRGPTHMPARCSRCGRGRKADWRFCAWCYGAGFPTVSARSYSDRRYTTRCTSPGCGKDLMPFMRYCPWCRVRVRKRWTFDGADGRCHKCSCGVAKEFWKWCPWCVTKLRGRR